MAALLIIGAVGVGLLLLSLIFGDFFDGVLDGLDVDGGGLFSTEVVGAFLGAFGFGGALLLTVPAVALPIAIIGGLAAGLIGGAIALFVVRSFLRMPTDATPRSEDLAGRLARVITRIPAGGLGEITVVYAGHRVKLSARSDEPIPSGTDVVIVAVLSPTSVLVAPSDI
ncbi:MAG TPA: NfeD family protein [Euzebyales bacterium]|nr:NfeD family protein [Euzebyales bacterium]